MADQLIGVLRQVLATDGERRDPIASRLFSPDLGSDPGLPDWRAMPVPLMSPDDPAAGVLTALATSPPNQILAALSAAPPSTEVEYQRVRALLELGETAQAVDVINATTEAGEVTWRHEWWEALAAWADGRTRAAYEDFASVANELPGELAPLLGMAAAAETTGDASAAEDAYRIVAASDNTYATAAFGLARILLARGDRHGAVDALREIPAMSNAYQAARAATVAALIDEAGGAPSRDDLVAASEALAGVTGDTALRLELTRKVMVAALESVKEEGPRPDIVVGGVPLEEVPIRQAIERACRALAKLAQNTPDRFRLVDEANSYRPRSLR
jgi:serine/threonine-protein kinase PknG